MAHESRRNIGASVRARLLERSRTERTDFQLLLTRYALERLMYRLGRSGFRDRFILKGAMLFVTWIDAPFRPTRDLDLLGRGDSTPQTIRDIFRAICAQACDDDGVNFDLDGLEAEPIREDREYGGVRVRTRATIDGARIPIQVDVGFGDAVTPCAVKIDYPALLDAPAPRLWAYPVETVIAEKFHAIVFLGMANSRLKDFYDLWTIAQTFELDRSLVATAVRETFARRETSVPAGRPAGLSDVYAETWDGQWRVFLTRERMTGAPAHLSTVIEDLGRFLLPLTEEADGDWRWSPRGGWAKRPVGEAHEIAHREGARIA